MNTELAIAYSMILYVIFVPIGLYISFLCYKRYQRLSIIGLVFLFTSFFFQGLLAGTAIFGANLENMGNNILVKYFSLLVMLFGLLVSIYSIISFKIIKRTIGFDTHNLITDGIYRYRRNPQYVGYGIIQFGAMIGWWNQYAIISIISYIYLVYFTVLIEEYNLNNLYKDKFVEYMKRTPRYY